MHLIKTRCSGFDESRTKKGGQQRLSSTTQWTLSLRNAKPRPTSKQRLSDSRNANARESPLRVPQTQLAFHPRAERNVSVIAVCICNHIIRPSLVTAEAQPQLQPVLLRLLAIGSQ